MASLSAVLILTVITFAHSQNSSNSHAIKLQMSVKVNHNRHICNPNPCDSGGFCVKCHADNVTCRSETDRQKGFVCLYPHANHLDACDNHRCRNQGECEANLSRPNGYRCRCQLGFSGETCEVQMVEKPSEKVDVCEHHKCLNEAECVPHATGHRCLCQPGFGGEFCQVQMVNKTCAKVPENICAFVNSCGKFGSCVPDPIYPGFNCYCDGNHAGTKCDWSLDGWAWHWMFSFAASLTVLVFFILGIVFCVSKCHEDK